MILEITIQQSGCSLQLDNKLFFFLVLLMKDDRNLVKKYCCLLQIGSYQTN